MALAMFVIRSGVAALMSATRKAAVWWANGLPGPPRLPAANRPRSSRFVSAFGSVAPAWGLPGLTCGFCGVAQFGCCGFLVAVPFEMETIVESCQAQRASPTLI